MASTTSDSYYLPEPSRWPITASIGVFVLLFGVVFWVNGQGSGPWIMLAGAAVLVYLLQGWFGQVIHENLTGCYGGQVDRSFRQGMFWFITSEAFFFLTFFGCLYYLRNITLPYLGGEGWLAESHMLWQGFQYTWPPLQLPNAANYVEAKEAMGPMGIPLINTIILLSSGGTITVAHWALKKGNNRQLIIWLAATIALGLIFFAFQAYEYGHAYAEMDLTLKSGIYGSTFYMLTGFHGLHVTIGTIMLMVILGRAIKGHFSPHNNFAFEGVAWYWHFVDVVWIGLYVFVYWL